MATNSPIEWTDATWNPVTGCSKISPGCKHCYAERMANRLKAMGQNELPQRVRGDPATANAGTAAALENTEADLRQFHERSLPCGRAALVYTTMCST